MVECPWKEGEGKYFISFLYRMSVFIFVLSVLLFPLQEFIAYGLMNVIGSFFSSFTAAGSLSRSTIQANSGGKTQVLDYAHRHTHTCNVLRTIVLVLGL